MNSKILLLSLAVITIGLFAMPSTLSMFAGQHSFTAGNTTICVKCHSDIKDEINAGGFHKSLLGGSGNDCKGCHTTSKVNSTLIPKGNQSGNFSAPGVMVGLDIASGNFTNATGVNQTGIVTHAAVTVECIACHPYVNFTDDPHKPLAVEAGNKTWLKGANEACIDCHTKKKITIEFSRAGGQNITWDFVSGTFTMELNSTRVNITIDP